MQAQKMMDEQTEQKNKAIADLEAEKRRIELEVQTLKVDTNAFFSVFSFFFSSLPCQSKHDDTFFWQPLYSRYCFPAHSLMIPWLYNHTGC
jgi:hypothetical protein